MEYKEDLKITSSNQKNSNIKTYIISNIMLLGVKLIFMLFSLPLISEEVNVAVRIIFGLLFIGCNGVLFFMLGRSRGSSYFKKELSLLSKKHGIGNAHAVEVKYHTCVYHLIVFLLFSILMLIFGVSLNIIPMHGIVVLLFSEASMLFEALGAFKTDVPSGASIGIFLPYIIILSAVFCLGFILAIRKEIKNRRSIALDIRSFNN